MLATHHTPRTEPARISPKPMLKALSWLARIGQPAGSGVRIATPKPGTQGSLAAPFSRLSGLGAESLLSRLHDRPTHRIRFLPLGSTHQHAFRGHPAHPRARHQPHSACLARFMLGNQNNQKRAALGLHDLRVSRSGRKILLGSFLASQFEHFGHS